MALTEARQHPFSMAAIQPARLAGRWRRYKHLAFGLLILLPFLLFVLFADVLATHDPIKISAKESFEPPSAAHWFGTDEMGHDVYSRVVHGSRVSLTAAVVTILCATAIGVVTGVIAGYRGGRIERLIMSIGDMVLSFPSLMLAMAVAAALGPSLMNSMLAVAAVWWPIYTRLMRGLTLQIKHSGYVEAARAGGASAFHIIRRHILPNALSSLNVRVSLDLGYAVQTLASLGFIGLGAAAPTPEWGAMVSWGRTYFLTFWWVGGFPALAIVLVVIGTSLVGDALNDLWNPSLVEND
ncbi:MAG: ABC transporter permease [Chloroflexi bacterium]|nr:ABC transporter permease [Chloroflexota bacterium]